MSLAGLGDEVQVEVASAKSFGRSLSTRELPRGNFHSDSSSVADALTAYGDPSRSPRARSISRRTSDLTSAMMSGDSMRETMTHNPPLLTGLVSPRTGFPTAVRRWRSCEQHLGLSETKRVINDADSEGSFLSRSMSSSNIIGAYRCRSPRAKQGGDLSPEPKQSNEEPSSPRCSPSVRSYRSVASTGTSCYNPRAKPGSVASEMTRSMSGSRYAGSSCTQDHLWRELFHSEADERKEPRLRGEGKTIGGRGKASSGIPWRQIPAFDSGGRMCETGDPHADRRKIVKSSGMTEKKRARFSPRLDTSIAVSELLSTDLAPVSENSENRPPPPPKTESEAREAWLDVVKLRCDKRKRSPRRPLKDPSESLRSSVQLSSRNFRSPRDEYAEEYPNPKEKELMHWSWRQQKSGGPSVNGDLKDTCPYHREDSSGSGSKSIQAVSSRSPRASPRSSLRGSGAHIGDRGLEPLFETEKVVEARRDYQFAQDKWDRDESLNMSFHSFDSSALGRSANARSYLSKSASTRSFSSTTMSASVTQVHSVGAFRRETPHRPRWK